MRVARHAGDEIVPQQRHCKLLRVAAELAEQAALVDLDADPVAHPVIEDIGDILQMHIPLRVRHDGDHTVLQNCVDEPVHIQRILPEGKLDQQIAAAVQRQQLSLAQQAGHVARAEHLHALIDLQRDAGGFDLAAQPLQPPGQLRRGIVFIKAALVAVRRGDDRRNAGLHGGIRHHERGLRAVRAVVQSGEDVGVNVDHCPLSPPARRPCAARPEIPPRPPSRSRRRSRIRR